MSSPLRRVTGILVLLCTGALAASGCAASSSGAAAEDAITVALALPTSWDPVTSRTGYDVNTISLAYAPLTQLDGHGTVTPGLASSWTYSDDGRALTFTLRDGLTFSDGSPVDADAAKAFFERGKTQPDSQLKDLLADVTSVSVDDPLTFTLHLSEVDYQLPYVVAGRTGMLTSIAAGKDPKKLTNAPVGAGPFTMTAFVPESSATFERNADYWDAADIHVNTLTLLPQMDAATAVPALQSGSVDVAVIPPTQAEAAKSAGLSVTVAPSLRASDASINMNKAPFDDPAVVEAFRYVFDRQAYVDTVTAGLGTVTHQPFPKADPAFSKDVEALWDYDPAKARQILRDAGYKEGEISLTITAHANEEVAAQLTQAQLAAVGVTSTITIVPPGSTTWQDETYVARSPQLALDSTIGRESPAANLLATFGPAGIMNLSAPHSDPAFTKALDKLRATPIDSPDYTRVLHAAVKAGVTQSPTDYLYSTPWVIATNARVGDLNVLPSQVRWEGVEVRE